MSTAATVRLTRGIHWEGGRARDKLEVGRRPRPRWAQQHTALGPVGHGQPIHLAQRQTLSPRQRNHCGIVGAVFERRRKPHKASLFCFRLQSLTYGTVRSHTAGDHQPGRSLA